MTDILHDSFQAVDLGALRITIPVSTLAEAARQHFDGVDPTKLSAVTAELTEVARAGKRSLTVLGGADLWDQIKPSKGDVPVVQSTLHDSFRAVGLGSVEVSVPVATLAEVAGKRFSGTELSAVTSKLASVASAGGRDVTVLGGIDLWEQIKGRRTKDLMGAKPPSFSGIH